MNSNLTEVLAEHKSEVFICALVMARIGPLVLFAPAIGGSHVPLRLRIALACCLAVLVVPLQLAQTEVITANITDFPQSLVSEALIGASLALALALVVAGLQMAGQVVGSMSGLSLARVAGGDGQAPVPAVGRVIELVALAAFVVAGGHRVVLDALLETFRWAPVGQMPITSDLVRSTIGFASHTFVVALRVAAPMAVALLLSIAVVGLISRAVPQMNTMSVGLGLNAAVLLAMLSICVGSAAWIFRNEAEMAVETVRAAVAAAQQSF